MWKKNPLMLINGKNKYDQDGSKYKEDPNNASVVPSDALGRLANAIHDLAEIEESYWSEKE